jgi:hypothetical protein
MKVTQNAKMAAEARGILRTPQGAAAKLGSCGGERGREARLRCMWSLQKSNFSTLTLAAVLDRESPACNQLSRALVVVAKPIEGDLSVVKDDNRVQYMAIIVSALCSNEGFVDRIKLCSKDLLIRAKVEFL